MRWSLPGVAGRYGADQQVLPTAGYEMWRAASLAQRWEQLARAWLTMTRQVGLVGQRDDRDRPITVLSAEAERAGAPAARRAVLGILADLEPASAPSVEEVLALLDWQAPRRSRGRENTHREVLAEAATLGVTGLGALTSYGRLLLAEATANEHGATDDPLGLLADAEDGGGAIRALDTLLPAPVDHFLVQADLTVVVPGPPEPALAAELEVVAEPESAGGASVHRITTSSVRRALDAGYSADDLHDLFRRRSRTPVPQGLTYLVDDAARKHGGLRIGSAGAYLRSDDEALLAEVLADRRVEALALRRLAPTVLVTPYQGGRLLSVLREAGYAPVAEDATGSTVLTRPRAAGHPPGCRWGTGRSTHSPPRTCRCPVCSAWWSRSGGVTRWLGRPEGPRRWCGARRPTGRFPRTVTTTPWPCFSRRYVTRRWSGSATSTRTGNRLAAGAPRLAGRGLPACRGRTHRDVAHLRAAPDHCGGAGEVRFSGGCAAPTRRSPRSAAGRSLSRQPHRPSR